MRVLVATTASPDDRKTLCAVRALGAAGAEVTVASDRLEGGAAFSRHVRRRVAWGGASGAVATDPDVIADALARELRRSPCDVLLPTNDYTTRAAARHRERLERRAAVVAPPREALRVARDKLETVRLARRLGIAVPSTQLVRDAGELERVAESTSYPCVLKGRRGAGAIGLAVARSSRELREAYTARPVEQSDAVYDFEHVLVQSFVQGAIHDVCVLMERGEPIATLTQRRLLTFPRRGGVGILNETTDEPELVALACRLLRELRWHGPAQVELCVGTDGGAHLLEINGRLWGTLDLAVAAGVDVPVLACRSALGRAPAAPPAYRVGLRYRWWTAFGLLAALESPEPWRTLWTMVAPARDSRSDLRLADPVPHLVELLGVARRMIARRSLRPERIVSPRRLPRTSR